MKIYAPPVKWDEPNYTNYNPDTERTREESHRAALRDWLKTNGYTGKYSGEIFRTPMADGYACYMLAEGKGKKAFLIHLPYGDAWNSRDVRFLPKAEIIKRIESDKKIAALFKETA